MSALRPAPICNDLHPTTSPRNRPYTVRFPLALPNLFCFKALKDTSITAAHNCADSFEITSQSFGRRRLVSFLERGRNNNQEARFVENGPLLGSVIVSYPTDDAPFTYFVEVYKRVSDSDYSQVLRYRGNTRYGDGNPLAVIDSEMPETLRRLGLWKEGDALPVPPRMPQRCTRLVMRKGVESCEP